MKTNNSLRSLLGITQQDMSLLLQVNRSQWSMFELGKRDLPLPAKKLLAELLTHIQLAPTSHKEHSNWVNDALKKELEHKLSENQFHQLCIAKKITAAEKKHKTQLRTWQLKEFIETQKQKNNSNTAQGLKSMALKTETAQPTQSLILLKRLEFKQERLASEQLLLEQQLKKIMPHKD